MRVDGSVVTLGDREVASNENSPTVTDTVLKGGDLVGGAAVARAPVVRCGLTKYDHRSVQSMKCLAAKSISLSPARPHGAGLGLAGKGATGAASRIGRAGCRSRKRPCSRVNAAAVVRFGGFVASVGEQGVSG